MTRLPTHTVAVDTEPRGRLSLDLTRAPIDLVFGCPANLEIERCSYSDFADQMAERLELSYREVRQALKKAAEYRKRRYDMRVKVPKFLPGQWVWYLNPRRYQGRSPKWNRCFTGPFMIKQVCGAVNFVLKMSPKAKTFVAHICDLVTEEHLGNGKKL